jgi:hypothetical protein
MTDDLSSDLETRARRRVSAKLGFYTHAFVFVLVNLGLLAINQLSGGYRWSIWPLAGWGLGLAIHGLVTMLGLHGDGLRRRMLDAEMARLKRR